MLAKKYISVEMGAPYSSSDTIFFSDVRLMPQIPLAVAVDNYNADNNSDGVGTHWAFIRKRAFSATYDANVAMKANMTSASPSNPFTHNGATWTAGLCTGGWRGAFTVYPTHQTGLYGGTTEGWGETTDTSPFIRVNTAGRTITATEANSVCDVGIDALMGHPKGDSSATALRFTVPADGIYTATIWAKDHAHIANTSYLEPNDTGVDVHLIAGSRHAAQEIINIHPLARRPVSCELTGDRLYLKAGETVTFAIGANGTYYFDLTSFYAWLDPDTEAEGQQRVNVDLNGAASGETAATFAGAGRVGFAGETWNGVAAADGVAAVESRALYASDGTTRTGAQLAIQRGEDGIAASAANLATDTAAGALFADGVVSTNSADAYSFTLTGLLPNTAYECYFYSRALTNAPPATSAAGHVGVRRARHVHGGRRDGHVGEDVVRRFVRRLRAARRQVQRGWRDHRHVPQRVGHGICLLVRPPGPRSRLRPLRSEGRCDHHSVRQSRSSAIPYGEPPSWRLVEAGNSKFRLAGRKGIC